jgi:hypothetical protein
VTARSRHEQLEVLLDSLVSQRLLEQLAILVHVAQRLLGVLSMRKTKGEVSALLWLRCAITLAYLVNDTLDMLVLREKVKKELDDLIIFRR